MWPDCSPPRMLPAPRISRSASAIWNPAPSSDALKIAWSRLRASSLHPLAAPVEQVRVRPPRRPPDAAAELVELGQPERVRPVDDDRVGVRDVQPRLDDRRADEDVGLARRRTRSSPSRARPRASGRGRRRTARRAPAAAAARPAPRSSRPGCGRRRPGRRGRARAGSRRGRARPTPRRRGSGSAAGPPAASR